MKIRNYQSKDRKQVEHINFETGFVGSSMSPFLSNNNLWKDSIKYYLEKEPQSAFVLENQGKVVGYVLGCLDDKNNDEIKSVFLEVFRNFFKSLFLPKKDRIYWCSRVGFLFSAILGISKELKFKTPKNAGHLHINLLPEARGKNQGSKLLKKFEKYAKSKGVKIIHGDSFQTKLNPNSNFWLKNGFKVTSKAKTHFWKKQIPDETIYVVCYTKKL